MTTTAKRTVISLVSDVITSEDQYAAAGFVLDCIMQDGTCDDPLGDSAALTPIKIARSEDGNILAVLCKVGPHGFKSDALVSGEQEILVTIPNL